MNLFNIAAALTLNSAAYEKGLKSAEGDAKSFGNKLKSGLGTAAKVGAAAIAAAGTAVVAFGTDAVKTGEVFDSSMAQVAATMGMTMQELQTQVGSTETSFGHFEGTLRDFAQFMGANTAFSASQAADALNYMALAGYDAQTAMDMLPNVLNLAAAGGIELASASDMVTDAQSALGLSLDETSELVDKMAKASSKSNTSVAQLGEAMLTIGGTAKNLTGGTTELSTALGILADNGIKGSEGGTALRNILLSLTPKSEAAADAMKKIGMNAYDADGNMRPLREIFTEMNAAMANMSTEERQNTLADIFNKVDLKSVNALMSTTNDRWWELSDAIDGAWGTADGFDAAMERLKKIPDKINFKSVTNGFESIGVSAKDVTTDIKKIDFSTLTHSFESLGVSAEDVANAFDWTKGNAQDFAEAIWEISDGSFEDVLAAMPVDLKTLQIAFDNTKGAAQAMADTQLDNLAGDITLFQSALEGAKIVVSDEVTPTLREFVQFGSDAISTLSTAFQEGGLSGAMEALGTLLSDGLQMVIDTLPTIIEAGTGLLEALIQGIVDNLPQIAETVLVIIENLAASIGEFLPELMPAVEQAVYDVANKLVEHLPELLNALLLIMEGLAAGIGEAADVIIDELPKIIAGIVGFLTNKETLKTIIETGVTLLTSLIGAWEQIINTIVNFLPDIIDALLEFFLSKDTIKSLVDTGVSLLTSLVDNIETIIDTIVEVLPDIIVSITTAIIDSIPDIVQAGVDLFVALVQNLDDIIVKIVSAIPEIIKGIVEGFKEKFSDIAAIGKSLLEGIWDGIKNAKDWLKNKIKEWAGGLLDGIKGFFGIHSPSRVMRDIIGKNIVLGLADGVDLYGDEAVKEMETLAKDIVDAADVDASMRFDARRLSVSDAYPLSYNARMRNRGDVKITQNIYAAEMTPSEVFTEARLQQERWLLMNV